MSNHQSTELSPGQQTRIRILEHATHLASIEGLEGLTIGRMAKDLLMSKSGLFAHFGSRESLQLAVLEFAQERFEAFVFGPAERRDPGMDTLKVIIEQWFALIEGEVFPGGCFYTAAAMEFDSRPGPIGNKISETYQRWQDILLHHINEAMNRLEMEPSTKPQGTLIELLALIQHANWHYQLYQKEEVLEAIRKAIQSRLEPKTSSRKKDLEYQEQFF